MRIARRREGGATAVEAALVTPVILGLMLAILEFGLFFKDSLSASEAVKAGVRLASAAPRQADYAQNAANRVKAASGALPRGSIQELWVYKANTNNNYPTGYSSFAGCTTCVKFTWTGTEFAPSYSNWAPTTQNACASGPPDRIGVYLKARHDALTTAIFTSLTIQQADVLRFEPVPASHGCTP
ncbi:pilus assembly protein [Phycicoccus sp. CSK15P-2]|uniref:TadE/TadG family type IV pilus assembly protein n=1 Tax=Phycicoccus sp. CSK15P-2 TaxID=2807627 RepID=UPI00194E1042|nr:TadE/TadG family type IV pilus assembly protein [Phycicoccus sp. CSK15P-2]MBM6405947.1 pilus assembly protein [Phycicoccus sp. CSK15P-2]